MLRFHRVFVAPKKLEKLFLKQPINRSIQLSSIVNNNDVNNNNSTETIELPRAAQVVICGGGVMGAAVAYHLSLMGLGPETVILESNRYFFIIFMKKLLLLLFLKNKIDIFSRLGGGTTWHSSGLVGAFKPSSTQVKLAQDSIALYNELTQKGLSIGWKQCGSLSLARTRDRMTSFRRMEAQAV